MLTDLEEYSDESRPVAGTLPEEGGEEQEEEVKEENCFRILLATDIHLGYLEENPIRGKNCTLEQYSYRSITSIDTFFRQRQFHCI